MARLRLNFTIFAIVSYSFVLCEVSEQTCSDGVDRPRLRRAMTQACDESNSEVVLISNYNFNVFIYIYVP